MRPILNPWMACVLVADSISSLVLVAANDSALKEQVNEADVKAFEAEVAEEEDDVAVRDAKRRVIAVQSQLKKVEASAAEARKAEKADEAKEKQMVAEINKMKEAKKTRDAEPAKDKRSNNAKAQQAIASLKSQLDLADARAAEISKSEEAKKTRAVEAANEERADNAKAKQAIASLESQLDAANAQLAKAQSKVPTKDLSKKATAEQTGDDQAMQMLKSLRSQRDSAAATADVLAAAVVLLIGLSLALAFRGRGDDKKAGTLEEPLVHDVSAEDTHEPTASTEPSSGSPNVYAIHTPRQPASDQPSAGNTASTTSTPSAHPGKVGKRRRVFNAVASLFGSSTGEAKKRDVDASQL